jgi:hypothetical protein
MSTCVSGQRSIPRIAAVPRLGAADWFAKWGILRSSEQNPDAPTGQLLGETMNDKSGKLIRRAEPGFKPLEVGNLVTREHERHGALMEALRQSEADE